MKIERIKPPKILMLPTGSLNVTSDVFLVGRSAGEAFQQVAEIVSSRLSGWSSSPVHARASMPSSQDSEFSRQYSSVKSTSAARTVRTLRSSRTSKSVSGCRSMGTKLAPPSDDAFRQVFCNAESLTYKYISEDNVSRSSFKSGNRGNLLKLVQHSMCVGLQYPLVPLPFRMPCQLSCAALNKQRGGEADLPETLTRRLMFFMRDAHTAYNI